MAFLLIIFGTIFVLAPIARAVADRISSEVRPEAMPDRAELRRLREEVERLSSDVARLQEEQSFMVRLLDESERKKLGETRQTLE